MSPRPDFFIVGAPKCGTTALASYLAAHPAVHMCVPKEPYFFCTDLPGMRWTTDLEHYESLFLSGSPSVQRRGEASVWYLYSKEAIANLYAYNPKAQLIVMLRDPAEMVYSLHGQYLYDPHENEPDLRKAWDLAAARKRGLSIPRLCPEPALLFYDEVARYGEQLERVYRYFPREQVQVILYDDFKADTLSVYLSVMNFLGLKAEAQKRFDVINPRKTVRSRHLQYVLRWTLNTLHRARMTVQRRIGLDLSRLKIHRPIMKALVRWNLKEQPAASLPAGMRRIIIGNYLEDIEKLERLIERDLSAWKRVDDKSEHT